MSTDETPLDKKEIDFLNEARRLAASFLWKTATLRRENEVACVAALPADGIFERVVWIYDAARTAMRCLMIGRQAVPAARLDAVFELCARVNHNLPFGCLEYAFEDKVLLFRDSADLDWGPSEEIIKGATSRVLNLGKRYASAIEAVLNGAEPEAAVRESEAQ